VPLSDELPADERRSPFRLVEFHDAVEALAAVSERAADVVTLRYLAGYTMPEVADLLGVGLSTAEADWRFARAWLLAVGGRKKSESGQGG
jgi:DNA-directed RNA polymerase specialized sigma24 family protein